MSRLAYLGPPGTHSHAAALASFPSATFVPAPSIPGLFDALRAGDAEYALVPLQNSRSGGVALSLDAIVASVRRGGVRAWADAFVEVHHCLLANGPDGQPPDLSKIRKVYSHNEALAQCAGFLARRCPGAELVRVDSTARAAEVAAKEEGSAAIASGTCSDIYGIDVMERDIEDAHDNTTRFVVISLPSAPPPPFLPSQSPSSPPSSPQTALLLLLPIQPHAATFDPRTAIAGTTNYALNLGATESLASIVEARAAVRNMWSRPHVAPGGTGAGRFRE
ncbi:Prephenate dehydratase-domain-containing protein, partial [Hyaloraphidium curvatum]